MRKKPRVGISNVRTLYSTGAARLLVNELDRANVSLMGLQEVRWFGAGETAVGWLFSGLVLRKKLPVKQAWVLQ